jgi:ubiquinone/menaquinone biosynthesis C-methylase UbiE
MTRRAHSVQDIMERDVDEYRNLDLKPPEQVLLRRLKGSWDELSMLDVGVGAGRTSYTFAAVAGRYLGIDVSPSMVELSRKRIGEDDRVSFRVADVCDLSVLDETFNVVLFSFNSIDLLDHDQRQEALRQMRSVLRPDGYLLFSTHSLEALPRYLRFGPLREGPRDRSVRRLYRIIRAVPMSLRLLVTARRLDFDAIDEAGWTQVRDGAHGFDLPLYYISVAEQRRELKAAGLELVEILGPSGERVDPNVLDGVPHLHYLCQPGPTSRPE